MGRFIAVEGGEGVGKSAFILGLARHLKSLGYDVVVSREPGGTPVADAIRAIFARPPAGEILNMVTEALLVSAGRSQHVEQLIRPSLAKGKWVLCDRYADSTRVYQCALGGLSPEVVESLISLSTGGLNPDLTFVLDCPLEVSLARLGARQGDSTHHSQAIDRYDGVSLVDHEKRRAAFLGIVENDPERHVCIDASPPTAEMVATALRELEARCGPI